MNEIVLTRTESIRIRLKRLGLTIREFSRRTDEHNPLVAMILDYDRHLKRIEGKLAALEAEHGQNQIDQG